jgi:hypothetical protein
MEPLMEDEDEDVDDSVEEEGDRPGDPHSNRGAGSFSRLQSRTNSAKFDFFVLKIFKLRKDLFTQTMKSLLFHIVRHLATQSCLWSHGVVRRHVRHRVNTPKVLLVFQTRVARWYIFKPKIPICVNFGGSCNGRCWVNFLAFWYNSWLFGIFCGHLV